MKTNFPRWLSRALPTIAIAVLGSTSPFAGAQQYRTVVDKEVGSIYQNPNGFAWTAFGIFDGSPQSLDPSAIRVLMAHFDKFYPGEDDISRGFPYSALRSYEAQQVAAGQPPIFVTATYEGKSRPVLFSWSLSLVNNVPTAAASDWQYAVNVQDPRFIHFWINDYVQPLMATYQNWLSFGPNLWFQLDECAFDYTLFGVLDDNNNFVAGVPWDSPFPQNETAYESGIESFFSQVKTLAPDILTMPNIGTMATPSQFPNLFENVPGAMFEDLYSWNSSPTAGIRNSWYAENFNYFPWLASQGRVVNLRALIPSTDPNALLTSFVVYSLFKGPNFFFAPGDDGGNNLNPSTWEPWRAQLGSPIGSMQSSQAYSGGDGYRLYSRPFEGGTVYLNWTGSTQTIQLGNQSTYYDPSGAEVTTIQIPDGVGTYVATTLNTVPAPLVAPRYSFPQTAPLSITMESATSGTTIHYTLDGTTPTLSSPAYINPVQLSSTAVVQARAFAGSTSSFSSQASYAISSSAMPVVQFAVQSDSGPLGSYFPVLSLSAVPATPVSVTYAVQNGTPSSGTYTFLSGMTYAPLPLTTASSGTMTVTITGASGASVGAANRFEYNPTSGSIPVTVNVSPASASLIAGQQQRFAALVSNASNQNVTWSVDGVTSGNSEVGTISSSGVYVAPTNAGSHIVSAASVQDPTALGSADITVSIAPNNPGFSITSSPATATITAGQSAQFTLTMTPVGGFNQPVAMSCAAPSNIACSASPKSVTLDGVHSVTVSLTATTTNGAAGMLVPVIPPPSRNFYLVACSSMLLFLPFAFSDARRLRSGSRLVVIVISLGLLSSCGGGKNNSSSPSLGNAAASYTLTVSATSGNLVKTTALVLTVN